jgi:hypothetical protein
VGLLDRLKAVKAPWSRVGLDGDDAAPAAPEPEEETGLGSIPLYGWIAGGILVAAWIGWTVYAAIDRSFDDAIGVLVAWPTLFAMAAIFLLPFIGIGWLVVRMIRGGDDEESETEEPGEAAGEDDADEPEKEPDGDEDAQAGAGANEEEDEDEDEEEDEELGEPEKDSDDASDDDDNADDASDDDADDGSDDAAAADADAAEKDADA